jgi:hypothetical protein
MILKAGGFPACDGDDLEFLTKPKAHPFSPFVELRKVVSKKINCLNKET